MGNCMKISSGADMDFLAIDKQLVQPFKLYFKPKLTIVSFTSILLRPVDYLIFYFKNHP